MAITPIGLILALISGCGPSTPRTIPVSGIVMDFDGSPISGGMVELESQTGGINSRGELNSKGEFQLSTFAIGDGAVPGVHRVIVLPPISPYAGASVLATHRTHSAAPRRLSSRLADYRTSELEVTIPATGPHRLTIRLPRFDDQAK
jgi:hypothetical protein